MYDITGIQGQYATSLPTKAPETVVPLATPLPIRCFSVDGKTVSEQAIAGHITHLADTSAEVVVESPVAQHSNLMLRLLPVGEPEIPEVYAKVMTQPATENGQSRLQLGLTSVPEHAKSVLDRQREVSA